MYLIKQRIRAHLFVNFALYKYLIIIIIIITLIRNNITLTTTDIHSTINTHNTELQMVKVHINTKHITIANIYIPPRDSTSTHYKTADTDIQHCIQYITNIPHSVLTRDVNAHSTLWHSYNHRGQQIADVISNSDHITLNTNTPTIVRNTTLQQTSSLQCLTHCTTGHRRQLNTHYHQTTYPSSQQLTYDRTTDYNKTDRLSSTTRKLRGHIGDGCDLVSTLCKYALRKGDLFVPSWARVRRVRLGSLSSD